MTGHRSVSADILQSGEWALAHAADFPLPLLLIHGSADRITCPRASTEFASAAGDRCTFTLVDGGYHELHNEPEAHEVLNTMVTWLNHHSNKNQVSIEPGEYAS